MTALGREQRGSLAVQILRGSANVPRCRRFVSSPSCEFVGMQRLQVLVGDTDAPKFRRSPTVSGLVMMMKRLL